MALILEVMDRRQPARVATAVPLGEVAITIGSASDNQLVLECPFLERYHARAQRAADGRIELVDLGSLNGLIGPDGAKARTLLLRDGDRVQIGRCTLRVRSVEQGEAHETVHAGQSASTAVRALPWSQGPRLPLLLLLAWVSIAAYSAWTDSIDHDALSESVLMGLSVLVATTAWAGVWASVGRRIRGDWGYRPHLAIISAAALGLLAVAWAEGWAEFIWPTQWSLVTAFGNIGTLVVLLVAYAAHLEHVTHLGLRQRWRLVVSTSAMTLAVLFAASRVGAFGDPSVQRYTAAVRFLPTRWIPAKTIGEFNRSTTAAQQEADRAAEESVRDAAERRGLAALRD